MADPFVAFPIPSEEITDLTEITGAEIDRENDVMIIRDVSANEDKQAKVGEAMVAIVGAASEAAPGVVQLATEAETFGQSTGEKAVHPQGLVRYPRAVATASDLEGLTGAQDEQLFYLAEPGYEGVFEYDSASTAAADGLDVFTSSGGGRFVRKQNRSPSYGTNPTFSPPPKPSKAKALIDAMRDTKFGNTTLGGGYYSIGTEASDFVYETVLNNEGGTNGTFNIRMRLACEYNTAGGALTVNVQMASSYAGVTVTSYAWTDSELPSTGRFNKGAATDLGSGLYQRVTAVPDVGAGTWPDYFGVEINMVPQNTANDDTLHQELWVVKRIWIVQDGNTLMDTDIARTADGAYLAQIAARVTGSSFYPEEVAIDSRTYYINHSRFMTGATVNACWVSKTGIDTGFGPVEAPVSINRAARLCQIGAVPKFIFKEAGEYEWSGVKTTNLFANTGGNIELIAPNGAIKIVAGHYIDMGSLSFVAGGFDVPYTYTNSYAAANIAAGTSRPKLILYGTRPLNEVLTLAEVAATERSYYWDLAGSKFVVNLPDLSGQLVIPECDTIISLTNGGYLRTIDVMADVAVSSFTKQLYGNCRVEQFNSGLDGGTVNESIFRHEQGHGFQVDCVAIGSGNDGFNYHDYGNVLLYNAIAKNSSNDGCSPHEDCGLIVCYGEYTDNGAAGIIPAYGANCIIYRATVENNNVKGLDSYGNVMALSDNSVNFYDGTEQENTLLTVLECEINGTDYGIISRGPRSKVTEFGNKITADTALVASLDQLTLGEGEIVTYRRDPLDIARVDVRKVSRII